MNLDQQDFYVTLFSNASQNLFAGNMIAAFTIHVAQTIELGATKSWEVGLCELTCPPQYVGTYEKVTTVGDSNVLVYCNLISPRLVDGELVRCLRTFIAPSQFCEHVSKRVLSALRKTIFPRYKDRVIAAAWRAGQVQG
jgi:hypothetical protein